MAELILRAVGLQKYFWKKRGVIFPKRSVIKAVDGVHLDVEMGRTLAIIGESGCGKTTLGCILARIYAPTQGQIWFDGENIALLQGTELKRIRKKMQMVFQDPGSSLNPSHRVGSIISLPLRIHYHLPRSELHDRVAQLLDLVHLPPEMVLRSPMALSGGEKQRVGIARALSLNPKVIILDEPTSALDVSVQAKMLHLLKELQQKLQLTYILVTHNLGLSKDMADHIVVMYLGKVIESADTDTIFKNPVHPYTQALLSAIPVISQEEKELLPKEIILEGELPSPMDPPSTCPFLSRCPSKENLCAKTSCPDLKEVEENHHVRCYLC
jgi:oligopeptide transport system ATP-binding protein